MALLLIFSSVIINFVTSVPLNTDLKNSRFSGNGETPLYWRKQAKDEIHKILNSEPNIGPAKNVILFLGDGMGVSTVTAARILQGQQNGQTGEENILSWEKFPHVALSKTYNQDQQTADSAGTATAFLCGIKANAGTTGVDASTKRYNCESSKGAEVSSILHWSMDKGKSTGIVTTARVTHATPASGYSSSANRNWEGDSDMAYVSGGCKDIARQLIEDNPDIQVIMGGGRRYFLPNDAVDPEGYNLNYHGRRDNRSLIQVGSRVKTGRNPKQTYQSMFKPQPENQSKTLKLANKVKQMNFHQGCETECFGKEWLDDKIERNKSHRYVWNASDFYSVNPVETDYLLGLFQASHMQYEIDRLTSKEKGGEPSLAEMTEKAIDILNRNKNGYFLLVEGGRIDHGHHDNLPKRALTDALAFADAIAKADELTNVKDTLIVVTADHSHVFAFSGYPSRGNPILGLADDFGTLEIANDGKPYTTLLYANGPGGINSGVRENLTDVNTENEDLIFQAAVPLNSETHGGEDVAIYARGPMSHLIQGVKEQHYIAHVMAYASCVGEYRLNADCAASLLVKQNTCNINKGSSIKMSYIKYILLSFLIEIFILS